MGPAHRHMLVEEEAAPRPQRAGRRDLVSAMIQEGKSLGTVRFIPERC